MSQLTYNGISLPYTYTTDFREEVVSDPSNTDRMLTKYDISVQGIINTDYLSTISGDLPATIGDPATVMMAIEGRLKARRKRLQYTFNGVNLIPARQQGRNGYVDAANGPVPQSFIYTRLNNNTFLFTYHIITHVWRSPGEVPEDGDNFAGSPVLSNRWKESVTIDGLGLTQRTRSGTMIIRSDNVFLLTPDELRSRFAVVGVPRGFLRESAKYTVRPDGLALDYEITDKEQFKMPPAPAWKAAGRYKEETGRAGAIRYASATVELWGDKSQRGTNQNTLISACMGVCAAKVLLVNIRNRNDRGQFGVLISASVQQDMYSSHVVCSMNTMLGASRTRVANMPLVVPSIAFTPGSEVYNGVGPASVRNEIPPPYTDRGTAGLLLQAAAYYDPSLANNRINPTTGQMNNGQPPGREA